MKRATRWAIPLLAALLLAALALSGCAPQTPDYIQPGITVSGTGSTKVTPDVATVTLGVQSQNERISLAVSDNNRRSALVHKSVVEMGVAEGDIRTTYFSVWSQPRYDEFGTLTGETTYFVDNTVLVTVRDVTKLGEILQAAIDAGSNSIQGISFQVEDPTEAEDQARAEAIADAQAKAQELATAAGAQLGEVTSITTSIYLPLPMQAYARYGLGGGGGEGPAVSVGTYEVQVQITITYALR
ncbi:MAG: SIMPL domain-containing protein [Anaerolineales bacterium]